SLGLPDAKNNANRRRRRRRARHLPHRVERRRHRLSRGGRRRRRCARGRASMPARLIALFVCVAVLTALAQDLTPEALVRGFSSDVLAALRKDPHKVTALVEARVLPHFDFRRTTQIAMGAQWRHASAEQQEELTREFRTLLVRTYSGALANYRDQAIEYRPLRMRP